PVEQKKRIDDLLVRFPSHAPAIEARKRAVAAIEQKERTEAAEQKALGKVKTASGVWCFPGQAPAPDGAKSRCVGVPTSCPQDFAIDAPNETCAPPPCMDDRTRTPDGVHCCWLGQVWSVERRVCVGNPTCSKGQVPFRERCTEPTAPLIGEVRRL